MHQLWHHAVRDWIESQGRLPRTCTKESTASYDESDDSSDNSYYYIDERIVHNSFCYTLPKAFKDFKPYIDERKKVFKKICAETEKLKTSWDEGKYLYSGESIPNTD